MGCLSASNGVRIAGASSQHRPRLAERSMRPGAEREDEHGHAHERGRNATTSRVADERRAERRAQRDEERRPAGGLLEKRPSDAHDDRGRRRGEESRGLANGSHPQPPRASTRGSPRRSDGDRDTGTGEPQQRRGTAADGGRPA